MIDQDQTGAHRAYYARRESQERAAADRSADAIAKRVHLELARNYADRVSALPQR